MPKKSKFIPINTMADMFGTGIAIGKATIKQLRTFEEADHSHRDDYHLFFLQEKGVTPIEIDFQKSQLKPSSVVYINPAQVHRIGAFENATVSYWVINNENLNPENLNLLESLGSVKPLILNKETFSVISQAVSLCIKISKRNHEKLYHSLLKESCNILVALIVSQYLAQTKSTDPLSRFDLISKAFKALLERDYKTQKKPAAYARSLNISMPYLNECVKNATGRSVSHHIQQRVILEAKRLLVYSNRSVKEIALELGYDDYSYFSRLFIKVAGMTALAFRNKNLE